MNAEEKYLFDLWGYVNIEGVLGDEELLELNAPHRRTRLR